MADTDKIFAAGLLNMMSGVRADMDAEEKSNAEMTRREGMANLNNRIKQQGSPSGFVMKDTGKPIPQSELESVPPDKRMTAGDFSIGQEKKVYDARQSMTQGARDEAQKQAQADKDYKIEQNLEERDYKRGREELKYKRSLEKEGRMDARSKSKGVAAGEETYSKKQLSEFRTKANKAYNEYKKFMINEQPDEEITKKDVWLKDTNPELYDILDYGAESAVANGEPDKIKQDIDKYLGKVADPVENKTDIKPEKIVEPEKIAESRPLPEQGTPGAEELDKSIAERTSERLSAIPKEKKNELKQNKLRRRMRSFLMKNFPPTPDGQRKKKEFMDADEQEQNILLDQLIAGIDAPMG